MRSRRRMPAASHSQRSRHEDAGQACNGFRDATVATLRRCARAAALQPLAVPCDLHLDLYVRSLHAARVARNAARRGWAEYGAGLDVVDGPMPRARDLLARHLALGERAATVGAGVVDGVEAPLQVEESDLLPRHLDALRLTWREFARVGHSEELCHVSPPPRTARDLRYAT